MKTPIMLFCAATAGLLSGLALLTPAQAAKSPAALTWSLSQYDFGSVAVGQTPSQTFTLTNTGGRSSGMITVTLSGSPTFTIIADGCTAKALRANESCEVTVQYPPINTNGDAGILGATAKGSSASMAVNGNGSSNVAVSRGANMKETSPIQGAVVGQYFTLYDGISKEEYEKVVAAAPFDKCNLLILAFVPVFTIDRNPKEGGSINVVQIANGRDPGAFQVSPEDTDGDRIKMIVETARMKNPSINILISLGYGNRSLERAALTPIKFADSVRAVVQAYDLNGFDIDFESTSVEAAAMLRLAQEIRRSLNKIPSKRPMIMTITPDQTGGLNKEVLEQFTYVMPQTYGHACRCFTFDDAEVLAQQLGSYERIVYGLNSEGAFDDPTKGTPDDPKISADKAKKNHSAGIFAWRLNADSYKNGFPTFTDAFEMWNLMNQQSGPNPSHQEPHSPRDQRRTPFSQP